MVMRRNPGQEVKKRVSMEETSMEKTALREVKSKEKVVTEMVMESWMGKVAMEEE